MSRKVRDWRERWNPDADFIFLRTVELDHGRKVHNGDLVPDEVRQKLGARRLYIWWRAGLIGQAPEDARKEPLVEVAEPGPTAKRRGRPPKWLIEQRKAAEEQDGPE